ncbi:hypothetical protein [Microlunatus sp. Gsoil 973]|uniref:hypothetical protein n=1 Tax=Microlunatus sp. Gsoil 973 TaxID=2672569 RepID=UPI0012B50468|nr:hypothetical protein [Microlunatus sp. Gsoil 973]QGN33677.1 hypothetical protein GJV80_13625 [Microlunatus sp. Gsoil 973]
MPSRPRCSWQVAGRAITSGLILGLVLGLLTTACTWGSAPEPGLFGRNQPSSAGSGPPSPPIGRVNPDLPVLGERTLTPDRVDDPPLRVALHALRRTPGGTLLDWSVTPLQVVGLRVGDPVDAHSTAAALVAAAGTFRIIDGDRGTVYRPLISTRSGRYVGSAPAGGLRIGVTSLLQIAFGALPPTLHSVSVELPGVELFTDVPVPDPGRYFGPTRAVDLARSPDVDEVIRWSPAFVYHAAGGQRFRIGIVAVESASDATSIVWSIWSITDGDGLRGAAGPPITDRHDALGHRSTASGLRLIPAGSARAITVWHESTGPEGGGDAFCLCTDLRTAPTDLSRARRSITVVSNLPPLPLRTQFVDVVLPGVGRMQHIPVSESLDSSSQVAGAIQDVSGEVEAPSGRWEAATGNTWPPPRPSRDVLRHTREVVARLD